MIAIADRLTGQYADMKALAGALVGQLQMEMRGKGWTGARILEGTAFDADEGALTIVIGPGHGELTVAVLSAWLKESRANREAAA